MALSRENKRDILDAADHIEMATKKLKMVGASVDVDTAAPLNVIRRDLHAIIVNLDEIG